VIYLDDRILTHPKLMRAGELAGRNGVSRALHLYLIGLVHAKRYLTNGFIDAQVVRECRAVSAPILVARCLSDARVLLWHHQPNGYQIHDYLDYNETSDEVKRKQQVTRERVARWRAQHPRLTHGGNGGV
jgi:hypothetical protein